MLTTGRLVHHFHTRTKTGRAAELQAAAVDEALQIAPEDGTKLRIKDGDWVRVISRRGSVEAQATIGDIEPGLVFLPFHFGYWDNPERARAANELTLYEWDAVSKQPHFKYAAVKLKKVSKPSIVAPLHQSDGITEQVRYGCGPGRTRVAGRCVARTTIRHTRRVIRRNVRRY